MDTCDVCGAEVKDFEECTHDRGTIRSAVTAAARPFVRKSPSDDFDGFESNSNRAMWPYLFAPLGAILLDYLIPLWSTWYITLLLVVASFMIINTVANLLSSGTRPGIKLFFMSLARSINGPRAIMIRSDAKKTARNLGIWIASILVATVVVFSNVTTMNANGLENRLAVDGAKVTGRNFTITCPTGFTSGLPGKEIRCHAKVLLGIKVPVTVQIHGPFEKLTWKAGW